ncbi:MAG: hypothetical protein KC925_02370 [Candidatus Doudnabacteria bacterium]|nr:hypothetical protein [Candidatus Doudnabacteria bacterium]
MIRRRKRSGSRGAQTTVLTRIGVDGGTETTHKFVRPTSDRMAEDALRSAAERLARYGALSDAASAAVTLREEQDGLVGRFSAYAAQSVLPALTSGQVADWARFIFPPRTGKSIAAGALSAAAELSMLILEPTTDLVGQMQAELEENFPSIRVGRFDGTVKQSQPEGITVGTYQIFQRMYEEDRLPNWVRRVGIVMCDEGHGALTEARLRFLREAFAPTTIRVATTATPNKSKQVRDQLETYFPYLLSEVTLTDARRMGRLAEPAVWKLTVDKDASEVEIVSGDYDPAAVELLLEDGSMFDVAAWMRYAYKDPQDGIWHKNVPALVACPGRTSAEAAQAFLNSRRPEGAPEVAIIHGLTPVKTRDRIRKAFNRGEIDTIVTVRVLLTGWNAPRCKLLIDLCPSVSFVLAYQKFFRVMTSYEGQLARMVLIHPKGLRGNRVMPVDVFGDAARVISGMPHGDSCGGYDIRTPGKKDLDPAARATRVAAVATVDLERESIPTLDPRNVEQVRRLLLGVAALRDTIPKLRVFKGLRFWLKESDLDDSVHDLPETREGASRWYDVEQFEPSSQPEWLCRSRMAFAGTGAQLLRFCGVGAKDPKAYFEFISRMLPEQVGRTLLTIAEAAEARFAQGEPEEPQVPERVTKAYEKTLEAWRAQHEAWKTERATWFRRLEKEPWFILEETKSADLRKGDPVEIQRSCYADLLHLLEEGVGLRGLIPKSLQTVQIEEVDAHWFTCMPSMCGPGRKTPSETYRRIVLGLVAVSPQVLPPPDEAADTLRLTSCVRDGLEMLEPRIASILWECLACESTPEEVGRQYGLTATRIRQILAGGIRHVRHLSVYEPSLRALRVYMPGLDQRDAYWVDRRIAIDEARRNS